MLLQLIRVEVPLFDQISRRGCLSSLRDQVAGRPSPNAHRPCASYLTATNTLCGVARLRRSQQKHWAETDEIHLRRDDEPGDLEDGASMMAVRHPRTTDPHGAIRERGTRVTLDRIVTACWSDS
jgi:hypothetical protein